MANSPKPKPRKGAPKVKAATTERGWPAHFIGASECAFRRNTLVECGDNRVVVSTVGGYNRHKGMPETIGCRRYFETMAFRAQKDADGYWDADVSREFGFTSNWAISHHEANADAEANAMHEAVVAEIAVTIAPAKPRAKRKVVKP